MTSGFVKCEWRPNLVSISFSSSFASHTLINDPKVLPFHIALYGGDLLETIVL